MTQVQEPPLDRPGLLDLLRGINDTAGFNRWAGMTVQDAEPGGAELRLLWRDDLGQYSGFLHAGMISALIDTACGFAAATLAGPTVLASHCAVNFLAPARGDFFSARARVVKAGRRQIFARAELTAHRDGTSTLVATGDTILSTTAR